MINLVLPALVLGNAALWLAQVGRDGRLGSEHLWLPLGYTTGYAVFLLYLRLKEKGPLAEPVLVAAVCALTGIGLAALARLDPGLAWRQLRWLYLGLLAMGAVAHGPAWRWARSYPYLWAVAGLSFLAWTALYGVEIRGARSWVRVGAFAFQPIEFVKILFVFSLASYLADTRILLARVTPRSFAGLSFRYLGPLIIMACLFVFMLTLQRDLGGALLLFGLAVALVTVATESLRYAAVGAGLLALAAWGAASAFEHVRTRFLIWLNPWRFADGSGYQLVESLFALGAGGFLGVGWGRGMGQRIPIVETDFIYSLLVEEIGLLGAAGVLFLLSLISLRTLAVAFDSERDDAMRLGAAGIAILFAFQTFLIVGGVTRLLPVTGVTLPFVSYGGSSLVASFLMLGLAYNLLAARDQAAWAQREAMTWSAR